MIGFCKRVCANAVFHDLFIAVVINNLEKAKEEEQRAADTDKPQHDLLAQVAALRKEMDALETALRPSRRLSATMLPTRFT